LFGNFSAANNNFLSLFFKTGKKLHYLWHHDKSGVSWEGGVKGSDRRARGGFQLGVYVGLIALGVAH